MKYIIIIGICILFLTGCTTEDYECRNLDNPKEIIIIEGEQCAGCEAYTLEKCRERVCNVALKQITP